jgi:hypothetical protein
LAFSTSRASASRRSRGQAVQAPRPDAFQDQLMERLAALTGVALL